MDINTKSETRIVVCGDHMIRIINWDRSEEETVDVVWEWQIKEAFSQLPAEYEKQLYPLDECKFADNNRNLLITASAGAVLLLEIETRRVLFYASAPLAHSAEIMPDGRIVVALSTHKAGNCIQLFDRTLPEKVLFQDRLYFGHALQYNSENNRLYALGFSKLKSYRMEQWHTDSPVLQLENTWTIPFNAGHDLCLVDNRELLITGREGVAVFDIDKSQFHPFAPLAETGGIKSINYNSENNQLIYTKGEIKWWTHHVYQETPAKKITINDFRIYKVRTQHLITGNQF